MTNHFPSFGLSWYSLSIGTTNSLDYCRVLFFSEKCFQKGLDSLLEKAKSVLQKDELNQEEVLNPLGLQILQSEAPTQIVAEKPKPEVETRQMETRVLENLDQISMKSKENTPQSYKRNTGKIREVKMQETEGFEEAYEVGDDSYPNSEAQSQQPSSKTIPNITKKKSQFSHYVESSSDKGNTPKN